MRSKLPNWLVLPEFREMEKENDESATQLHKEVILRKPFLKKLFLHYYHQILNVEKSLTIDGTSLEIGSGGGFLKEIYPAITTSDILKVSGVDRQENACALSFPDKSLKAIYGLQTLHHLSQPREFFKEASRTLKPGGKIGLIEPFISPFGHFVYKNFHYEFCDFSTTDWEFDQTSPLGDSNQALPTIIFKRDRDQFLSEFPELEIESVTPHTFLVYLLSGGIRYRSILPSFLFYPWMCVEWLLTPLMPWIGTMQTIVLRKRG